MKEISGGTGFCHFRIMKQVTEQETRMTRIKTEMDTSITEAIDEQVSMGMRLDYNTQSPPENPTNDGVVSWLTFNWLTIRVDQVAVGRR